MEGQLTALQLELRQRRSRPTAVPSGLGRPTASMNATVDEFIVETYSGDEFVELKRAKELQESLIATLKDELQELKVRCAQYEHQHETMQSIAEKLDEFVQRQKTADSNSSMYLERTHISLQEHIVKLHEIRELREEIIALRKQVRRPQEVTRFNHFILTPYEQMSQIRNERDEFRRAMFSVEDHLRVAQLEARSTNDALIDKAEKLKAQESIISHLQSQLEGGVQLQSQFNQLEADHQAVLKEMDDLKAAHAEQEAILRRTEKYLGWPLVKIPSLCLTVAA